MQSPDYSVLGRKATTAFLRESGSRNLDSNADEIVMDKLIMGDNRGLLKSTREKNSFVETELGRNFNESLLFKISFCTYRNELNAAFFCI